MLVQVEWLDAIGFVTAWMTRNQNEFRVFHCQVAAVPGCSQVRTRAFLSSSIIHKFSISH
jgi:hypothetical protein